MRPGILKSDVRNSSCKINSGGIGISIARYRDTAVPFPYNQSGVGKRVHLYLARAKHFGRQFI
ncbi:hypothetical protein QT972_31000, partial [Microcoleus sp. herbarium7]|uniref:hypothetical protein n=1 Tax=unclassified Microcoleus TaxID=2642155 RepID=UPI002FD43541